MCTVSWVRTGGGYALFCNRDEQRTRGPEHAPAVFERDGVRYLSPRDADGGGTWVTANEFGLSLSLLNGYAPSRNIEVTEWTSRGLLVDGLAHLSTARELEERLHALDLSVYQPFQLLAIDPGGGISIDRWDGLELDTRRAPEDEMPLVSSGVEAEEVRAHRRRVLHELAEREGRLTPESLEGYHRNHEGGPSQLSTCMHRPDAKTRSLSRITVDEREVRFDYKPGSPCETDWGASIELPLCRVDLTRAKGSEQ